jgi:hypothetical protein
MDRPLRIAILTCSDTRSEAEDTAGAALRALIEARGWEFVAYAICPDEEACISEALIEMADVKQADVVLTCGGTGFGPRGHHTGGHRAGRRAQGAGHRRAHSCREPAHHTARHAVARDGRGSRHHAHREPAG